MRTKLRKYYRYICQIMWNHFIIGFHDGVSTGINILNNIYDVVDPKLLVFTSQLFLLPMICYIFTYLLFQYQARKQARKPGDMIYIMFSMIYVNFIISAAFWSNPIKHSMIHYIDAIAAKTTIIILSFTIFIRLLFSLRSSRLIWWFIGCLSIMGIFFYLSNLYSHIKWCCKEHIITHMMAHIVGIISVFFLFL